MKRKEEQVLVQLGYCITLSLSSPSSSSSTAAASSTFMVHYVKRASCRGVQQQTKRKPRVHCFVFCIYICVCLQYMGNLGVGFSYATVKPKQSWHRRDQKIYMYIFNLHRCSNIICHLHLHFLCTQIREQPHIQNRLAKEKAKERERGSGTERGKSNLELQFASRIVFCFRLPWLPLEAHFFIK